MFNSRIGYLNGIKVETIPIVALIILYKISLELVYIYLIYPRYYYQGFVYDFSFQKYWVSTVLLLLMIYPMISLLRKSNLSSNILFLICMVYFIPGNSLYALANLENKYFIFFSLYWMLIVFWQLIIPSIKQYRVKGNPVVFNGIIFGFAIFTLLMSGIYTDFRLNLDLSNVYDLRLEARELDIPIFVKYIQNAATMIIPIGLIYYIVNRKKMLSFAIIFIQLLEFSFAGKKSVLFITLVAILVANFLKKNRINQIVLVFFLVNIVAFIEFFFIGASELSKYIQRRVFFMPALIASYYFDFFSQNEILYLRQSILRWFGAESPYDEVPIQRLIGLLYFGNIENNANTGLIGDAFANMGWVSLLIYPLLIIVTFRIFEFSSKGVNYKILALVTVITTYKFISGSFFTVLLNGGFLLACFTMFVCPRYYNRSTHGNFKEETNKW